MNNATKISASLFTLFSLTHLYAETHQTFQLNDHHKDVSIESHENENNIEIPFSSNVDNLDFFEQEVTIEEFTQQLINLIVGILENQRIVDEHTLSTHLIEELTRLFSTYTALIKVSCSVHRAPTMPEQSALTPERQEALNNLVEMFVSAASIATNTKDRTNVVTNVVSMAGNLAKIIMSAVEARQSDATRGVSSDALTITIKL